MKTQTNILSRLGAAALALLIAAPLYADQHMQDSEHMQMQSGEHMQSGQNKELWTQWRGMQEKLVSAKDLLAGEVSDGFNPIGRIRDLVLTSNREQVQYVLYETPFPYSVIDQQEDGFVAFDQTSIERDLGYGLKVRFDAGADRGLPERLTLTASQADRRLASNLIGEPLYFEGDDWRTIEDLLVDRDTGQVTHYVIEMNQQSLFNENPLAVPAELVTIENGSLITAPLDLAELAGMQEYDLALL
jgi:hypothetical protein